jgi:LmbE family N-acetylglucosaminyl deacetylase
MVALVRDHDGDHVPAAYVGTTAAGAWLALVGELPNPTLPNGKRRLLTAASSTLPRARRAAIGPRPTIYKVLDDSEVERVLVIAAHPDDVDFGAAGTVATWTQAGQEVIYCIATDGDAGGSDPSVSRADMVVVRRAEQVAAAKCVGVDDVRFLGYPDGRVEPTLGLRKDLARVIRQVRPDRLVSPSPDRNYARMPASHPDHRAVGSAALDAVYPDARNQFAFPELLADEGLAPWTVREVWLVASPQVDHFVDITETFGHKLAALQSHQSQVGQMENLEQFLRGMLSRIAAMGGLPEGRLAEAFQIVPTG